MSKQRYPSAATVVPYALCLAAWFIWIVRLPDAVVQPGIQRWSFPAMGLLIAMLLAVVHCRDRDVGKRIGLPVESVR